MNHKRTRKLSQAQEQKAAEDIGGRQQLASGALRHGGGGDVRAMGDTRIECKYTEKKQYTLKHDELKKLQVQALKGGVEMPILQVSFVHPAGSPGATGHMDSYAVIPWEDYLGLLKLKRELEVQKESTWRNLR